MVFDFDAVAFHKFNLGEGNHIGFMHPHEVFGRQNIFQFLKTHQRHETFFLGHYLQVVALPFDVQHIVELLFLECKKPEFMAKLYQCGKLMNVTDGKPDKLFKSALNRIGPDEREQTALADCFKKGRKEAHRDDLGAFGKAWVAYMEAGGEVRKIGVANLKK